MWTATPCSPPISSPTSSTIRPVEPLRLPMIPERDHRRDHRHHAERQRSDLRIEQQGYADLRAVRTERGRSVQEPGQRGQGRRCGSHLRNQGIPGNQCSGRQERDGILLGHQGIQERQGFADRNVQEWRAEHRRRAFVLLPDLVQPDDCRLQ